MEAASVRASSTPKCVHVRLVGIEITFRVGFSLSDEINQNKFADLMVSSVELSTVRENLNY